MVPKPENPLDDPRDANLTVSDELAWRAFCYFHGELAAEEADAFEARLANEQSAREALSQAVELSHAAAAALASSDVGLAQRTVRKSTTSRRTVSSRHRMSVCSAICLALVFVVSAVWRGKNAGDDRVNTAKNDGAGNHSAQAETVVDPRLLAQALPSVMDAWPVSPDEYETEGPADAREQVSDPGDGSMAIPGLANDWVAMAFVAAQGASPQGNVKENR
jgi:hypothetical protein